MIPALLAIPMVEGLVGQVVNTFAPASATPSAAPSQSFTPALNQATAAASAAPSVPTTPTGTLRADQWNQMSSDDMKTLGTSLSGRHVDATDDSGRTISGTVSSAQVSGNTLQLNIGGHLVALSNLKQISWSPAV